MSRRLQRRIVSVVAAVAFFATGAVDAYGLHSCPHHDALPAPVHDAGDDPAHNVGGDAAYDAGAVHVGAPHGSGAHGDDHGPCSCVGECSITTPPAPVPTRHITIAASLTAAPSLQIAATQPRLRAVPHVLPYANAPPHR